MFAHDSRWRGASRKWSTPEPIRRGTCCVALASLMGFFPTQSMGAAWTRPQGDLLIFTPAEYTVLEDQFDDDGDRVDRPRFEMLEISPYIEYGFTDNLTIGAQPRYRYVEVETANGDETNSGLAETDIFARFGLWRKDQAAFSVQGLVKAPINPDENDPAALGRDQVDAEISLLYGNRHPRASGTVFYNIDVGFRKRFEEPADEVHTDAFIGWSRGSWTFVLSSTNTMGLNNEEDGVTVLTAEPSFRLHEIGLSGAYHVNEALSAVAGASTAYAGRDVGAGVSGFVGVTLRF